MLGNPGVFSASGGAFKANSHGRSHWFESSSAHSP